jgi:hypothetical protein
VSEDGDRVLDDRKPPMSRDRHVLDRTATAFAVAATALQTTRADRSRRETPRCAGSVRRRSEHDAGLRREAPRRS